MVERTYPATLQSLMQVTAFVDAQLEMLRCPMKAQMQLDVAMDELFGNIVRYAYGDAAGEVTVRFDYDEASHTVSITLVDRGKPFNPLENADPDVTCPAEEREIGGLGIYLVRNTMDEMIYQHDGWQNLLTIRKRIG